MKTLSQYWQLLIIHWQNHRPGHYRIEFRPDGRIKAIEAPSRAALERMIRNYRLF